MTHVAIWRKLWRTRAMLLLAGLAGVVAALAAVGGAAGQSRARLVPIGAGYESDTLELFAAQAAAHDSDGVAQRLLFLGGLQVHGKILEPVLLPRLTATRRTRCAQTSFRPVSRVRLDRSMSEAPELARWRRICADSAPRRFVTVREVRGRVATGARAAILARWPNVDRNATCSADRSSRAAPTP